MFQQIIYTVEGPVATITLNRPAQLNAWTDLMAEEVRQAFHQAEQDQQVVGIILTGADRAFCAGADLSLLDAITAGGRPPAPTTPAPGDADIGPDYRQAYSYIASIRKPVIAAIHGACVGMALPIALFCDLRFASDKAFFMTAFSQRGLIAEWGSSWLLPRMIGTAHAMDMLLSSRRVYADEAYRMGFVNRVVPHEQLIKQASDYIHDLAQNCAPNSMAIIKRQLHQDWMNSLDTAQNQAVELMLESFNGDDLKEGVAAIVEKRAPNFAPLDINDNKYKQ
jgi:enoyl-CoA hydratase/carnithine racemase